MNVEEALDRIEDKVESIRPSISDLIEGIQTTRVDVDGSHEVLARNQRTILETLKAVDDNSRVYPDRTINRFARAIEPTAKQQHPTLAIILAYDPETPPLLGRRLHPTRLSFPSQPKRSG